MSTKKATRRPKTTALVAFCAGTTVLSRTVATTFSSVSTASVVQSATALLPVVASRLTRLTERTRRSVSPRPERVRRGGAPRTDRRARRRASGCRRPCSHEDDGRGAAVDGARDPMGDDRCRAGSWSRAEDAASARRQCSRRWPSRRRCGRSAVGAAAAARRRRGARSPQLPTSPRQRGRGCAGWSRSPKSPHVGRRRVQRLSRLQPRCGSVACSPAVRRARHSAVSSASPTDDARRRSRPRPAIHRHARDELAARARRRRPARAARSTPGGGASPRRAARPRATARDPRRSRASSSAIVVLTFGGGHRVLGVSGRRCGRCRSPRCSTRSARPREMRDRTVPGGTSSTSAISA